MKAKDVLYGVIGCGEHAVRGHIQPGLGTGLSLAGVFDPVRENASRAASLSRTLVTHFVSAEALIESSEIEAVLIASPDIHHPDQLLAAVKADKHVLVDKPLAINAIGMVKVREALRLADRKDLVVSSCHPRRFDPPYIWMKRALPRLIRCFGAVVSVHLDFSYHKPQAMWKHRRSLLLDHFPHEIDYVTFLLGEARLRATRLHDGHDAYGVAGVRADGITFSFSGPRRLDQTVYPENIRVRFERGEITINTKTGEGWVNDHSNSRSETLSVQPTDYDVRFRRLMGNFVRAVRGREKSYLPRLDLVVNTESAVALAHQEHFNSLRR